MESLRSTHYLGAHRFVQTFLSAVDDDTSVDKEVTSKLLEVGFVAVEQVHWNSLHGARR